MQSFNNRYHLSLGMLSLLVCACSQADANPSREPALAPRELVVTASDFAFRVQDTVPAGLTRIRLKNDGGELHHVQLVRLDGDHTLKEFLDRFAIGDMSLPWASYVGGPETSPVHGESDVTLDLQPGNYAMICVISSKDGVRHVAKGMAHAFTVLPAATTPAVSAPQPDVRVKLRDYAFDIEPALTAGRHTLLVENEAAQPHHVGMIRLHPGKTFADVEEWQKTPDGPPPFDLAGGTTMLSRGNVNYITRDYAPGEYVLYCFAPDATDGKSHVAHGMLRQLSVR